MTKLLRRIFKIKRRVDRWARAVSTGVVNVKRLRE